jgi:uncharacterized protein (TIGR03118 family)
VDVFGHTIRRIHTHGPLNSPWGLAIAPPRFGRFAGALLVGNFGDGWINAFDRGTGALLGHLETAPGTPLVIDGLWGLQPGNGFNGGDASKIYFTAGPGHESHGLFGSLAYMPDSHDPGSR